MLSEHMYHLHMPFSKWLYCSTHNTHSEKCRSVLDMKTGLIALERCHNNAAHSEHVHTIQFQYVHAFQCLLCVSEWCNDNGVHESILWRFSRQMIGRDRLGWQDPATV